MGIRPDQVISRSNSDLCNIEMILDRRHLPVAERMRLIALVVADFSAAVKGSTHDPLRGARCQQIHGRVLLDYRRRAPAMSDKITDSKELAAKAADELERRGWMAGGLTDDSSDLAACSVCLIGAIGAAYFGDPLLGYGTGRYDNEPLDEAYHDLLDEIAEGIGASVIADMPLRLTTFNDRYVVREKDPTAFLVNKLREYAES